MGVYALLNMNGTNNSKDGHAEMATRVSMLMRLLS